MDRVINAGVFMSVSREKGGADQVGRPTPNATFLST